METQWDEIPLIDIKNLRISILYNFEIVIPISLAYRSMLFVLWDMESIVGLVLIKK